MKLQSISRRNFVEKGAALAATSLATGQSAGATSIDAKPFLTPADEFYDVSRGKPKPHMLTGDALVQARLTEKTWRLEIAADPATDPPAFKEAAQVEKPVTLDFQQLLDLGSTKGVKYIKAMQCLNIAEPLGQGLWEGVPLRDVLRLCGRLHNVRRIYYRGFHNNDPEQIFQSSVSYTQAMETPPGELPVFLAYRLNGEPISLERGGPVRMLVPWAHGFKSIKWLQQISLTNDYRTNDTYALRNNDPESFLKTAAYVDSGPEKIERGEVVTVLGQVISGLSGLDRVETWTRKLNPGDSRLADDDPQLLNATWTKAEILPPPDWNSVLPTGVKTNDVLGFDSKSGEPLSWPLRYGMGTWVASIRDLKPGKYEIYARSIDRNGFAQPEPRAIRKSGKNMLQVHQVEVV
ncbi:MAG: molybdopterin-dependent oxidoreductase [Verrucomicrobiota bacterium]